MQSWIKPFAAAWRARGYFAIAFFFWLLSNTIPPPFSTVAALDKLWWQDLIAKAVGSFDKISYLVLIAGLVYAVISDVFDYVWTNSLQTEVQRGFSETANVLKESLTSFTSGLVGMTFESVKVWIEGGRGKPDQIRTVAHSALISYYGKHNLEQGSFLMFSLEDMLDNWASASAQTWENFSSDVTIRSSNVSDHFEWEENRSYTLVCISSEGELPLRLEGSVQVKATEVIQALNQMRFSVRAGRKTILDLASWWGKNKIGTLPPTGTFRQESDGIVVDYDGFWLRYELSGTFQIQERETPVAIYERSLISREDRCYSLALRHPTHGLKFSLSLEGLKDWIVKAPGVSAKLYKEGNHAVNVEQHHQQTCTASMSGWSLPGVAVVIEWSPS
jgi:hypothetical protein